MRAALRDKRRATAIEREVEITLLRAAAMDVWNAVASLYPPVDPVETVIDHNPAPIDPLSLGQSPWKSVPVGSELPRQFVQAINRLGCAIRGEWHLLDGKTPSAPEPPEGDSRVAPPPAFIDPGATSGEIPRCCENECADRAEHDEFVPV